MLNTICNKCGRSRSLKFLILNLLADKGKGKGGYFCRPCAQAIKLHYSMVKEKENHVNQDEQ